MVSPTAPFGEDLRVLMAMMLLNAANEDKCTPYSSIIWAQLW